MVDIAYQGVEGAYSQMAAEQSFRGRLRFAPKDQFAQVFRAVVNGSVDFGIVPIENSLAGSIHQNYDLLLKHQVWICGEVKLRVQHNLLARKGETLQSIRQVLSHPQALAQCARFIGSMRRAKSVPFFDTAGAAQHIGGLGDSSGMAAIASARAAEVHGLKILKAGIEDNPQNFTRFFILEKRQRQMETRPKPKKAVKTSIVFTLKNIPGALYKSLSVFAIRDIDLYKVESRPLAGSPWKYLFYLDFAGDCRSASMMRTLEHLQEVVKDLKVLGSYEACE